MISKNNTISLGEGNTPLIRLYNLEKLLDWQNELWVKAEYQNPTGSFKDRGSIAEIKEALSKNKKGVVCASTGNMAASLTVYSSRARLKCFVIVPSLTPENKLKQALICGAEIIKVKGNYDSCVEKAKNLALKNNLLLCGDYQSRRLGQKTVGVELAKSGILFDAFVVPVGNGTLGCAIAEGFAAFRQLPKFIGAQGKGADPIYQAWQKKLTVVQPILQPKTIASAMKVGNPIDGSLTLQWVKKTKGLMLSITDQEIIKSKKLLALQEGIFVETSAAATLAGLIKIKNELTKLKVVLILTGSGLKENSI